MSEQRRQIMLSVFTVLLGGAVLTLAINAEDDDRPQPVSQAQANADVQDINGHKPANKKSKKRAKKVSVDTYTPIDWCPMTITGPFNGMYYYYCEKKTGCGQYAWIPDSTTPLFLTGQNCTTCNSPIQRSGYGHPFTVRKSNIQKPVKPRGADPIGGKFGADNYFTPGTGTEIESDEEVVVTITKEETTTNYFFRVVQVRVYNLNTGSEHILAVGQQLETGDAATAVRATIVRATTPRDFRIKVDSPNDRRQFDVLSIEDIAEVSEP